MAERLGTSLLAEIKEESLDELLRSLRPLVKDSRPTLSLPSLDTLLEIFCSPKSSPQYLHGPNEDEDGSAGIDGVLEGEPDRAPPQRRPPFRWKPVVVEVNSARGVWSRALLYRLAAVSTLPVQMGGLNQTVVWLDSNACFSATKLKAEMDEVLPSKIRLEANRVIQNSLDHCHVFSSQSSEQLIKTLKILHQYLFDISKHISGDRRLGLIVLDSATSFYWQDRVAAEEAYYMHTDKHESQPSRTASVITQLQKLQQEFDCAIVFSTSSQSRPSQRRTYPRQGVTAMPEEPRGISSWTAFATLNLRICRSKDFQAADSLARHSSEMDKEPTSKRALFVEPETSLSDRWTASTKSALQKLEWHGKYRLRSVDQGW